MKKKLIQYFIVSLSMLYLISCNSKNKSDKAQLPPSGTMPQVNLESNSYSVEKSIKTNNENIKADESKELVLNKSEIINENDNKKVDESIKNVSLHKDQSDLGFRVNGNVLSLKQGNLSFQTRGFISQQYVNVGDKVKKGQIIAILDDRSPLLQKKLQQQNLQLAKVKFEQAKRELERTTELIKKNATTPYALEQAQDIFASSQIQLSQAETNLTIAEKAYNDTRLVAPYDGKISGKFKDIGEFVSEGVAVFSAFEDKDVEISLLINEAQFSKVKIGMNIDINVPSIDASTKLKITKIVDLISKETRMFEVRGKVMTSDINLVPGQFVEAEF
ncbi:efflux RND transporter periplasmic adaptor subunit [Fluviispira vulneris]|uniref:efflux RND transporter periplasmic adaptor subunit n=1 Tax=Fluviispira vulneris TaxID=2763012 RepID=UPI001644C832|nr:efflux RND transporter periplasmic adaptor subunit [Fluviispira vulneris]